MKISKVKETNPGLVVTNRAASDLVKGKNATPEPSAYDYTAVIRRVQDGDALSFVGRFKELGRSVVAEGSSPEQTIEELYQNGQMLLNDQFEDGEQLPQPEPEREWQSFSGKITVRIPRSLHYKLFELAEDENVSLNHLISTLLTWGAERKHCEIRPLGPYRMTWNVLQVAAPLTPPQPLKTMATGEVIVTPLPLTSVYG